MLGMAEDTAVVVIMVGRSMNIIKEWDRCMMESITITIITTMTITATITTIVAIFQAKAPKEQVTTSFLSRSAKSMVVMPNITGSIMHMLASIMVRMNMPAVMSSTTV